MGRGRKAVAGEPRPYRLPGAAVTATELEHARAAAASRGMKLTDLQRTVCDLPVLEDPKFRRIRADPELAASYRELATVLRRNFESGSASNLNQITRHLNVAAQRGDPVVM